jgi:GNAT superfamily N-acetyltransferase
VHCRPAREADKPDVLALTARIWEGHDYVPEAWDQWLADEQGVLAVAELEGTVVGIGKLTRLGPQEWWLEGLRVHPDYQGKKISSRIFEYLVEEWKRTGEATLRLATSSERVQIHHLCRRLGFQRTGVMDVVSATPTAEGEYNFEPMTAADAEAAVALSRSETTAWGAPGLVNIGWQWSNLTASRVEAFACRGRAWWWHDRTAALLLYDYEDESRPDVEVTAILCPPEKLADLLRQARVLAARLGAQRLIWTAPDVPRVLEATKRAGFVLEWDARLWIFEHSESPSA